jgi:hypothetical protein
MDYFQGVVIEYLRADRATFVNTEYLLQLDDGDAYLKGRHWYCDAVAVNHKNRTVELCEITYSSTLQSIVGRLQAWSTHWPLIVAALHRDSSLQDSWLVRPHVFVPQSKRTMLENKLATLASPTDITIPMPKPMITELESLLPWLYRSWNQKPYVESSDA